MAIWFIGHAFDAKPCPDCANAPVLVTDTGTDHFWMECKTCERDTKTGSAYSAVRYWNEDLKDDDE